MITEAISEVSYYPLTLDRVASRIYERQTLKRMRQLVKSFYPETYLIHR